MSIVFFLLLLGSGSSMETGPAVYSGGAGGGGGRDNNDDSDDDWGHWKGLCLIKKNSLRANTRKKQKQSHTHWWAASLER